MIRQDVLLFCSSLSTITRCFDPFNYKFFIKSISQEDSGFQCRCCMTKEAACMWFSISFLPTKNNDQSVGTLKVSFGRYIAKRFEQVKLQERRPGMDPAEIALRNSLLHALGRDSEIRYEMPSYDNNFPPQQHHNRRQTLQSDIDIPFLNAESSIGYYPDGTMKIHDHPDAPKQQDAKARVPPPKVRLSRISDRFTCMQIWASLLILHRRSHWKRYETFALS